MQTSSQQMKNKTIQTRDQEYAVDAYNRVKTVKPMSKTARDRYGSMAHKLPILIRTAGLAQALAFVNARGKVEHRRLLNDLALTLKKQSRENLAETAINAPLSEYIYLTQQALAALLWYKRFAQSVLDVQPGTEESE
jgi:CRISPR-associated protein Cmr5